MPKEPEEKRAISFIDGQNLFRHTMDVFGHNHPIYDPKKTHVSGLSVCGQVCGMCFVGSFQYSPERIPANQQRCFDHDIEAKIFRNRPLGTKQYSVGNVPRYRFQISQTALITTKIRSI